MNEAEKKFETWTEVIVDFFENWVENIQNNPKTPCKIYKARKYIEDKEQKIKSENNIAEIEKLKKAKDKKRGELDKLRIDAPSTEIRQWIDKTSKVKISEGKRIIKSTHVLRFSHSSSLSDGIFLGETSNDQILTTSSLKKIRTYDLAHNNGALITISRFLALKLSEKTIIDLTLNNDFSYLKPFSKNQEQLDNWCDSFRNLVEKRKIEAIDQAKQVYFPLTKLGEKITSKKLEYHLIAPLFSSTLAEEIFNFVTELKFGEEQADIKKQKKESNEKSSKYHHKPYIDLNNLGIQKFGGAQPQNVSMLNKNRSGKSFLFSSQPPYWQNQLKPPIHNESFFNSIFLQQDTRATIDYLRDFLLRFQRIDLSIKDPERRKWIVNWVGDIIEAILAYADTIHNLQPGWSNIEDIRLKPAHQHFLDPFRNDEAFQAARKASDWQSVICSDFAHWLNSRLIGKEKQFTPQREHRRLWIALMQQPLREYSQALELEVKTHAGEGL